MKYKVPIRVSVAPVQTYQRIVVVEATSREEAAERAREGISDLIQKTGWRSVGGRLESTAPNLTTYEIYLDEHSLAEWATTPEGK